MITEIGLLAKGVSVVEKNSKSIFDSIMKFARHKITISNIDCKVAFDEYIKNAIVRYSKVKTLFSDDTPRDFYDVFVRSNLKYADGEINCNKINDICSISNFIQIEGTAGIGKSTMMNHFFLDAIYSYERIPILVQLRDVNDNDLSLLDNIYSAMEKLGFTLKKEYFEYALFSGLFLILLDGFDEVVHKKQRDILVELNGLSARYHTNSFIISSRHCPATSSLNNYIVFNTIPLSKEQAIELVEKTRFEETTKEKFIGELRINLYDRHVSFASIPLLLMIMLMTFKYYAKIPNKLHIFYSQAVETLFYNHDARKENYERNMKSKVNLEAFKTIFASFCFITYFQKNTSFSKEYLIDIFNNIKDEVKMEYDSKALIDDLVMSVCLMKIDGLNYTFSHRSFQEYFTAIYIKTLLDEDQIMLFKNSEIDIYTNDSVFYMLYDMDKYRFEENYIIPFLENYTETKKNTDLFNEILVDMFSYIGFDVSSSDDYRRRYYGLGKKRRLFLIFRVLGIGGKYMEKDGANKFVNMLRESELSDELRSVRYDGLEVRIYTEKMITDRELVKEYKNTNGGVVISKMTTLLEDLKAEHKRKSNSIMNVFKKTK